MAAGLGPGPELSHAWFETALMRLLTTQGVRLKANYTKQTYPQKKNARGERAFSISQATWGEWDLLRYRMTTLGDIGTRIPETL